MLTNNLFSWLTLENLEERATPTRMLAYGTDGGVTSTVFIRTDADNNGTFESQAPQPNGPGAAVFTPFGSFIGGVRVAMGDIDGDGNDELITAAGAGGTPHVQIWRLGADGSIGALADSFFAYDPGFNGGVYVATGDLNGDGRAEVITGAGAGGGPHVKIWSDSNRNGRVSDGLTDSFYAYQWNFPGGVRVAAGDVNNNGKAEVITGAGFGFVFIIVGIGLGYLAGKIIGLKPGNGIRTFALAAGCQNFGFTAVPVVEILWGTSAVALLFVHNLGVEVAIWSVGVMLMSGENGIPWKRLVNGPIIAVIIGLTLVTLRVDDKVTGPIRTSISMIGTGAFPLAIMITGATIMDLVGTEKPSWKIVIAACIVRLFAAPAIIILCAKYIPMAVELRQILLVQAAMPAALVPILLARLYGGRPAVAVQVVIGTTVVSIFTLPYIIFYGIKFLNLTPLTP